MSASYSVSGEELSDIRKVFDDYCLQSQVTDERQRSSIASHILARFGDGATSAEDLTMGLPATV